MQCPLSCEIQTQVIDQWRLILGGFCGALELGDVLGPDYTNIYITEELPCPQGCDVIYTFLSTLTRPTRTLMLLL